MRRKAKHFEKKFGDIESVAVLETLHHNLALAEFKTLEDTVDDVEAEKLIYGLNDTPRKENAEGLRDTLSNMKRSTAG